MGLHPVLTLLIAAQLAAAQPLPAQAGPALVLLRTPNVELSAVRLSVPVREPPGLAGAARVLQKAAAAELAADARAVGAELHFRRVPGHAVYTAVGPADAFDTLVALLRRAVGPLAASSDRLRIARAEAERELRAELELPEPRLLRLLRLGLFGEDAGVEAAPGRFDALSHELLRRFQAATYRPADMNAVVVADVPVEVARSAFVGWPAPAPAVEPPAEPVALPPPPPQVVFGWTGLGYRADELDAAALIVAGELVRRRHERSRFAHGRVEVWRAGERAALVLTGGARPGDERVVAMAQPNPAARGDGRERQGYLRRLIAEAAALLSPESVRAAAADLRRDVLFAARTPAGMAELVGSLPESGAALPTPHALLAALERVDADAVRHVLATLLRHEPLVVEVVP